MKSGESDCQSPKTLVSIGTEKWGGSFNRKLSFRLVQQTGTSGALNTLCSTDRRERGTTPSFLWHSAPPDLECT